MQFQLDILKTGIKKGDSAESIKILALCIIAERLDEITGHLAHIADGTCYEMNEAERQERLAEARAHLNENRK